MSFLTSRWFFPQNEQLKFPKFPVPPPLPLPPPFVVLVVIVLFPGIFLVICLVICLVIGAREPCRSACIRPLPRHLSNCRDRYRRESCRRSDRCVWRRCRSTCS